MRQLRQETGAREAWRRAATSAAQHPHSLPRCTARLTFLPSRFLATSWSSSDIVYSSMAVNALAATTTSLRTFFQTRTDHHHAANDDATELRILTPRSNDDSSVRNCGAGRTSSFEKAASSEGLANQHLYYATSNICPSGGLAHSTSLPGLL
jgi:hypothetical protein